MKSFLLTSLLLAGVLAFPQKNAKRDRLPDFGLTPIEMIQNHGYPSEVHYVTTEDNYIVTLLRIPYGKASNATEKRPAVLLNHGLGSSAADYICMGPGRSLSYVLADAGFDVWLLSSRGTVFSRNHTTLDPEDPKDKGAYFDFSWHEIGIYDIPASIDHILAINGDEKVHYVGHSQGGTSLFAMGAARPEYNAKIALASLMAPNGIMAHHPLLLIISEFVDPLYFLAKQLQIYEIPFLGVVQAIMIELCPLEEFQPICYVILSAIGGGPDYDQFDWEYIDVIGTNTPSSFAIKQIVHYAQCIKTFGFNYFDYGTDENLKIYGQSTAPAYDLQKIVAPIAIYYGLNDRTAHFDDARTMIELLPNVVEGVSVPYDLFNHIDFIFAHDVVDMLYNDMISVMKKY